MDHLRFVIAWLTYPLRIAAYHISRSRLLRILSLIVAGAVLSFVTMMLLPVRPSWHWLGACAIIWLALWLAVSDAHRGSRRIGQARAPQDWQRHSLKTENVWVTPAAFDRIRFAFDGPSRGFDTPENDIRLVTHEARSALYLRLVRPAGGLVIDLVAEAFIARSPYTALFAGPLLMLCTVVALYAIGVVIAIWLAWSHYYVVFTTRTVRRIRVPPAWLPWLQSENEPLSLEVIHKVWYEDSLEGNLLGYGTLRIGTPMQDKEDENFTTMPYLPRHRKLAEILRGLLPGQA